MRIDKEKIPHNCFECKIRPTCDALPRWAEKEYFDQFKDKRHSQCPYTELLNLWEQAERREP